VDFSNVVLIMTSNLGSEAIQPELEFEVVEERVMAAVRAHFRPEFLNRIDEIIVFDRLTRDDIRQIVEIQLRSLRDRLSERRIELMVSDEALDALAEAGYDPVYGARPLKRAIQRELADPLALRILSGEFGEGSTVKVTAEEGALVIG
jgi:ATP-dependent Clp protease ATP-binding subunit ClpB